MTEGKQSWVVTIVVAVIAAAGAITAAWVQKEKKPSTVVDCAPLSSTDSLRKATAVFGGIRTVETLAHL